MDGYPNKSVVDAWPKKSFVDDPPRRPLPMLHVTLRGLLVRACLLALCLLMYVMLVYDNTPVPSACGVVSYVNDPVQHARCGLVAARFYENQQRSATLMPMVWIVVTVVVLQWVVVMLRGFMSRD